MKKITFFKLTVLFFLTTHLSNAQLENIRIDLETIFQKDPASPNSAPVLVEVGYTEYFYANGGNQFTSALSYSKPIGETEWIDAYQILRYYDGENRLSTSETYLPDGMGGFIPSSQFEYEYDENDNPEILYQRTHNTIDWVNYSRVTATYNPDNTQADSKSDLWNPGTSAYDIDDSLINYTYDSGNNTLIERYAYSGMTPVIDYQIIMTYTAFDKINDRKVESWNGSSWENGAYTVYFYDDPFSTYSIQYFWDTSLTPAAYVESFKTINTDLALDGVPEVITLQGWDKDEANGGADPFWYTSSIFQYNYTTLNTVEETINKSLAYPNPFKSQITISLPNSMRSDGTLIIYNSLGKEVSKSDLKQGTKSININNPYLAKGIYFIKVSSEDQNQTFKVIKE